MDALKKITEGMTGQESAQIIYQNDVNSLTDYTSQIGSCCKNDLPKQNLF